MKPTWSKLSTFLYPVLMGLALIGLGYVIHFRLSPERQFLLPTPGDVWSAVVKEWPTLSQAAVHTGVGALLGFLGAVILSFLLALLLAFSGIVRLALYPLLMILQMTPIIIIAPILILWVGPGLASVATITFLICFFPMVVNTTQGLISADRNLVDYFRMCRATRAQEMFYLRIPSAMPYFFTGLRIAATLATIGAIVGDMYAGNSSGGTGGLGFMAIIYSSQFQMPALFATAAIACCLGFVFVSVVLAVNWLVLHKWHDSFSSTDR